MKDMSSLDHIPSPVVCPLAKLGRSSPSSGERLPYASIGSSPPPLRSRRFRNTATATRNITTTASCESLDYKSLQSQHRLSDISCDGVMVSSGSRSSNSSSNIIGYTSPAYRYQQQQQQQESIRYQSPLERNFYRNDENCLPSSKYFQATTLSCHSPGRSSPYLDQGYHTLVPPSPPLGWPSATSISSSKYKKTHRHHHHQQLKCSHFERLPDAVTLHIFSWLSTNELCSVSRVCRRWYNLAWDQSLWKTIALHGEGTCADRAVKSILRRLCGQGQNGSCSTVKQLFVYDGAKITDKGLTSLSRRCTELTYVQLQNCTTLTDSSVSELATKCPGIQHLDMTGCSLISCISLIPSPDLPQKLLLQHLDLTDCISVQDSSLRIILRNCPQLTYLYLRRCSRITDAGVKFVPSFCSSMRELSVSDCHLVTDFALYELAKLGSNLRYLSVAKCGQVSDAGLKVIAKRCYKLRYLNVRGCEAVSDDALTAVARSCPRLRALDIGKCDVSDAGLKVLAENCPNLKKLSLRNCDLVTNRGIQYVCYYCRGLQQLNIQDCQISLEGYKAVKRFCKRCIIEHTNPGFF